MLRSELGSLAETIELEFDGRSISEEQSASNARMSSPENTLDSMHHAVRHQEHYIGDIEYQQTEFVESKQKYTALLSQCIRLKLETAQIEKERFEMDRHGKFMKQSVAQMIVENLRLHKKVDALRSEIVRQNERISQIEPDNEDQRDPLDEAFDPDTEPTTKGLSNITWLSGKALDDALQREQMLRRGNSAKIWALFSLPIDSAMRWIRNERDNGRECD